MMDIDILFIFLIVILKKIITQYNEKTYMKKEIVSDRDGLKIYILLYRQDQNDIQISEAQNVKGYVYQNDLQKRPYP